MAARLAGMALRFIRMRQGRAAKHFQNILSPRLPHSQARGHYWLARAKGGPAAMQSYKAAAQHAGTFYGQLSAQRLGVNKLHISTPSRAPRIARASPRAISCGPSRHWKMQGTQSRADMIYRHLSESLESPGELALLAARAEKRATVRWHWQIGKTAQSARA